MVAKSIYEFLWRGNANKSSAEISKKPMVFVAEGTAGTDIVAGRFDEEYLQKLFGEDGIRIYDQMRRSDGQVKMLLSVIKNPIKSAAWSIEPVGEDDEDYEIAEFVKYVLFKKMGNSEGTIRPTFREFVSEALTCIDFGHSVFEVVHKVVKGDPVYGDFIGISELGFRHQRSIEEWHVRRDGSIAYIRQRVDGDLSVDTPIAGQHCLVFSIEKEGANYEGISMLRACYGAWFRKNIYRKLQAIGIERCAKSIPVGTVSVEAQSTPDYAAQLEAFEIKLNRLAAHESNAIVCGAGFSVTGLKLEHDAEKVQKVIDSENIEMSKAFLASFMELGLSGSGGSYAMSANLSDIFLNSLQYIADMICERMNLQVIETIVRAKYGEPKNGFPKLKVSGINEKAGKEMAEIVAALIGAKGIQASTRLQRHLHQIYKLPEIDEEIAEVDDDKFLNPALPPSSATPTQLAEKKNCCDDGAHGVYRLSDLDRESFPVSGQIEDAAGDLEQFMSKSLRARADGMLSEMRRIINKGGAGMRNDVLAVGMPKSKAYTTALEEWAGRIVEESFAGAIKEVGLKKSEVQLAEKLKKAPKALRDKLITITLLTATYQDADIEKAVYFAFNAALETAEPETIFKEMEDAAERYFDKATIATAALNMASNVVNSTRRTTFLSPDVAPEIESFVFVNPDPVSPICRALNGKVFSKEEFESSTLTPPLHHNCKSYIRAQTTGKAGNLPITGLTVDGSKEEVEKIMRSKTL